MCGATHPTLPLLIVVLRACVSQAREAGLREAVDELRQENAQARGTMGGGGREKVQSDYSVSPFSMPSSFPSSN